MDPRTALVTGAGRGLGEAIARYAGARGYRVGVLDIDPQAARKVAADIDGAVPLAADSADEQAVEAAFDELEAVPDLVVCNAGIVRFGPLLDLEVSDWRAVVDVNLTGTFITARAAARRMRAHGVAGSIVNITSMNGVAPGPNAGAYGATKAAIGLLTQQMAIEWGPERIRVNAVAPGLIDAGMSEPIYADPEFRQRRSSKVPLGRLGTADDVAAAVLFLGSDDAAYISGQVLLVDGAVAHNMIGQLPRPKAVDHVGATD
jgi:NAD(P)-dependent dehydrogenase (short-subunit alcohol dehydrogenase family)